MEEVAVSEEFQTSLSALVGMRLELAGAELRDLQILQVFTFPLNEQSERNRGGRPS